MLNTPKNSTTPSLDTDSSEVFNNLKNRVNNPNSEKTIKGKYRDTLSLLEADPPQSRWKGIYN